jgi:hypothetical protein
MPSLTMPFLHLCSIFCSIQFDSLILFFNLLFSFCEFFFFRAKSTAPRPSTHPGPSSIYPVSVCRIAHQTFRRGNPPSQKVRRTKSRTSNSITAPLPLPSYTHSYSSQPVPLLLSIMCTSHLTLPISSMLTFCTSPLPSPLLPLLAISSHSTHPPSPPPPLLHLSSSSSPLPRSGFQQIYLQRPQEGPESHPGPKKDPTPRGSRICVCVRVCTD